MPRPPWMLSVARAKEAGRVGHLRIESARPTLVRPASLKRDEELGGIGEALANGANVAEAGAGIRVLGHDQLAVRWCAPRRSGTAAARARR
jgi:hypothetical protein